MILRNQIGLCDTDTIVLADISNRTGESVLHDALSAALSSEWIDSRVCLSVWIDRIDNLANDKLIEVDDLLEMSQVHAHRLRVEPKAI